MRIGSPVPRSPHRTARRSVSELPVPHRLEDLLRGMLQHALHRRTRRASSCVACRSGSSARFAREYLVGSGDQAVDTAVPDLAEEYRESHKPLYLFVYEAVAAAIVLNGLWFPDFRDNLPIVRRWVLWHWLGFVQKRNPNTPGLASKLVPAAGRRRRRFVDRRLRSALLLRPGAETYLSSSRVGSSHHRTRKDVRDGGRPTPLGLADSRLRNASGWGLPRGGV